MQAIRKKFKFSQNSNTFIETDKNSYLGYEFTGIDGVLRRIIMVDFKPKFKDQSFEFEFQTHIQTSDKEGNLLWSFKEVFNLRADTKTWLGASGIEYLERLPHTDPLSAWNQVADLDSPILDNLNQIIGYNNKLVLKPECLITNFDMWYNQLFISNIEPVLSMSITNKGYYNISSIV